MKKEDTPLTLAFSREVKAVFAEVDESDITNESDGNSMQSSENIVDALKHNPYIDSDVPSFDTSLMQHAESWDAVEKEAVKQDAKNSVESRVDVDLLKSANIKIHGRRASDSGVTYAWDRGLSDYPAVLPPPYSVKLEPINLSRRKTNKKKKGKGKKPRSIDAESSADSPAVSGIDEVNSFFNSLNQNVAPQQSGINDRIQVAKCLASSACADSSVHNRVERIKVSAHSAHSPQRAYTAHSAYSTHSAQRAYTAHSAYSAHSAQRAYTAHSAYSAHSAHSPQRSYTAHSAYRAHNAYSAHNAYNVHSAYSDHKAYTAHSAYSVHIAYTAHSAYRAHRAYNAHSAYTAHSAHNAYNAHCTQCIQCTLHTVYTMHTAHSAHSPRSAYSAHIAYSDIMRCLWL